MISIFEQFIHLPGDNDIGGENGEYISNLNIHRIGGGPLLTVILTELDPHIIFTAIGMNLVYLYIPLQK